MKLKRRCISLLLALSMVGGQALSMPVYAAENAGDETAEYENSYYETDISTDDESILSDYDTDIQIDSCDEIPSDSDTDIQTADGDEILSNPDDGMLPYYDAEENASDEEDEPQLITGDYVEGDVIICYEQDTESSGQGEGHMPGPLGSGQVSGLESVPGVTVNELLDVSEAAVALNSETGDAGINVEEKGADEVPGSDPHDSRLTNNGSGEAAYTGRTVLTSVHSDTLTTEELIELYSDMPGVVFAEPDYVYSILSFDENDDIEYSVLDDDFTEVEDELEPAEENDTTSLAMVSEDEPEPEPAEELYLTPVDDSTEDETDLTEDHYTALGDGNSTAAPDLTGLQYAYGNGPGGIDVPDWNDASKTNTEGVVVAVLDTGVDPENPDIAPVIWDEGLDYQSLVDMGGGRYGYNAGSGIHLNERSTDDTTDTNGHGTHCAGIIAGAWNDTGVSGAANGARIMAVRNTVDDEGHCHSSSAVRGYAYMIKAVEAGVNLVALNCSWGGPASMAETYAVRELAENGIVVCFASGNDHEDNDIVSETSSLMREMPGVVFVNSNDINGNCSTFSNYGLKTTHLYAPGTNIMSTYPTDRPEVLRDITTSPPARDANNQLLHDTFDGSNSPFEYDRNEANGSSFVYEDGVMKIKNINTDPEEDDAVTTETTGAAEHHTVAATIALKGSLPDLGEGRYYTLILREKTTEEDPAIYLKVYVRTTENTWERPALTSPLSREYDYDSYRLDVGRDGGVFDTENMQIRLVAYARNERTAPIEEIDIDDIWITAADPIPYVYLDGTSMATPAVTGAVAILAAKWPEDSVEKRTARLLAGTKPDEAFKDKCITGGLCNVRNSLDKNTYTPVIESAYVDYLGLHIGGHFFGTKENTTVELIQNGFMWSTSHGSLALTEVSHPDQNDVDYGELLLAAPADLQGRSDISVTVTDAGKPDGRRTFSRTLMLGDKAGILNPLYTEISIPDEIRSQLGYHDITGIVSFAGGVYVTGKDYDEKKHTFMYRDGAWSTFDTVIGNSSSATAWNGRLVYLVKSDGECYILYINPDGTYTYNPFYMIKDGEDDPVMGDNDQKDLYYDGSELYMIRTPYHLNSETKKYEASGNAEVYTVDPFTGIAEYIGELGTPFKAGSVIGHHTDAEGHNTIYVIGPDDATQFKTACFDYTDGEFHASLQDLAPENFKFEETSGKLSGAVTRDGIYLTGIYGLSDDETEYLTDNYYLDFEHPEYGLIPMKTRIAQTRVFAPHTVACGGRVYFMGAVLNDHLLTYTDAVTLDDIGSAYVRGSNPARDTDRGVKLKKLYFGKKTYKAAPDKQERILKCTAVFKNKNKTTDIFYTSSNTDVVVVDPLNSEGGAVIRPLKTGKATITAYCGNKKATCRVNVVKELGNADLELSWPGKDMDENETFNLKTGEAKLVTLLMRNTVFSTYLTGSEKLTWTTSNKKVATVNKGLVRAVGPGKAEITVRRKSGNKTCTCKCYVNVTSIEIPKNQTTDKKARLNLKKTKLQAYNLKAATLTATLTGSEAADREVIFTTTNSNILTLGDEAQESITVNPTVSAKGKVSADAKINAHNTGTAYIVAETRIKGAGEDAPVLDRKLCKVSVTLKTVELKPYNDRNGYGKQLEDGSYEIRLKAGSDTTLGYYTDPYNSTDLADVKWSCKGSHVTCKNGLIKGVKAKYDKKGKCVPAVITMKVGSFKYKITVYVTKNSVTFL